VCVSAQCSGPMPRIRPLADAGETPFGKRNALMRPGLRSSCPAKAGHPFAGAADARPDVKIFLPTRVMECRIKPGGDIDHVDPA